MSAATLAAAFSVCSCSFFACSAAASQSVSGFVQAPYPPYLKGEGWGFPQFHLFSPRPHKRENGTLNGIPGVTPLPQFRFEGGGGIP